MKLSLHNRHMIMKGVAAFCLLHWQSFCEAGNYKINGRVIPTVQILLKLLELNQILLKLLRLLNSPLEDIIHYNSRICYYLPTHKPEVFLRSVQSYPTIWNYHYLSPVPSAMSASDHYN